MSSQGGEEEEEDDGVVSHVMPRIAISLSAACG